MRPLLWNVWLVLVLLPLGAMAATGAYSPVRVDDENVIAAAKFAVKAQNEIMRKTNESGPAHLELVKISRARQQIVSGVNYELYLRVSLNGKEKDVKAIVWWQAWRKPDPYRLSSWEEVKPVD